MAVDDVASFHKRNLTDNKEHYTYFVRLMKGKPAKWLHQYGAKMHFNTIKMAESELRHLNQIGSQSEDLEDGEHSHVEEEGSLSDDMDQTQNLIVSQRSILFCVLIQLM